MDSICFNVFILAPMEEPICSPESLKSVSCSDIIKFVRHFFSSDGNKNIWDYISRQHSGGAGKTGLLAGVSAVVRVGLGEDVRCVSSLSLSLSLSLHPRL